jgi:hypothetical protein
MTGRLRDKAAVVTGAGSGIGKVNTIDGGYTAL